MKRRNFLKILTTIPIVSAMPRLVLAKPGKSTEQIIRDGGWIEEGDTNTVNLEIKHIINDEYTYFSYPKMPIDAVDEKVNMIANAIKYDKVSAWVDGVKTHQYDYVTIV